MWVGEWRGRGGEGEEEGEKEREREGERERERERGGWGAHTEKKVLKLNTVTTLGFDDLDVNRFGWQVRLSEPNDLLLQWENYPTQPAPGHDGSGVSGGDTLQDGRLVNRKGEVLRARQDGRLLVDPGSPSCKKRDERQHLKHQQAPFPHNHLQSTTQHHRTFAHYFGYS